MRCRSLIPMTLVAVSVAVPVAAQVVSLSGMKPKPTESHATADAMVARLMSFDRNHDGRLARNELPERMQGLFARADVIKKDDQLDATEVRSLAERPAAQAPLRGFQPGQYGFGDGPEFDTRLHIDGAVDDLRLAAATREKVLGIVREFQSVTAYRTTNELIAGMSKILTSAQLADFKNAMAHERIRSVPTIQSGGVTIFGATPQEMAGQKVVMTPLRLSTGVDPSSQIAEYHLNAEQKKAALALIEDYHLRKAGRLTDADRTALLAQMKGLLDDQQRDDLRAALERRPIVNQNAVVQVPAQILLQQRGLQSPTPTFAIQDLLLRQ